MYLKMDLLEKAYRNLYPEKELVYKTVVSYHGNFRPFNANIKLKGSILHISLSKEWKDVSEEIVLGIIQELLGKLFKSPKKTEYIDLYHKFVKNLHLGIPKTKNDIILEDSFIRVNEKYFFGVIEKPNLQWGDKNFYELGEYDYLTDTITISSVFKIADAELLDFIMYHELLHKKHKFKSTGLKNTYHTTAFKEEERKFENFEEVNKKLRIFLRRNKRKDFFQNIFKFFL